MAKYEWHKDGSCCPLGAVCSVCGKPIKGEHHWFPREGKSCYYHDGTCIAAAKLGAVDLYGEYVKRKLRRQESSG